jgi:transcriptional regulator with XRE-family HTH domain
MKDIAQRIKEVRKENGNLTVVELAKRIGESEERLRSIELRKQRVPSDILTKIIDAFNIDGNWLLTGRGDMHRNVTLPVREGDELLDTLELLRKSAERAMEIVRKQAQRKPSQS